jgi:lysozyme family protein
MADFDTAITLVLKHEGSYVNNPLDPGGETNYGISKRSYPNVDIKNLTVDQAKDIYKQDYWNKIQGDLIDDQNLANNLLDFAVNAGIKNANMKIQQIVNAHPDGIIGPVTLESINSLSSPNIALIKSRISYYASIVSNKPSQAEFLNSWVNRTLDYLT